MTQPTKTSLQRLLLPFETVWVLSLQYVSPRAALTFQGDPRSWGIEMEHTLSVYYVSLLINPLLPYQFVSHWTLSTNKRTWASVSPDSRGAILTKRQVHSSPSQSCLVSPGAYCLGCSESLSCGRKKVRGRRAWRSSAWAQSLTLNPTSFSPWHFWPCFCLYLHC